MVQRGLLPVGGSLLPQHRGGRGERGEADGEVNISTHIYVDISIQYLDTSAWLVSQSEEAQRRHSSALQ